ncbi:MAG TPA: glycosyltransferase family 39 protein [Thermoanaerobaculia bacterium]|nr:glycosyltransferase family 39 protein [Thermoanaerobaculia bacterium]
MKRIGLIVLLVAVGLVLFRNQSHGYASADQSGYLNLSRMLSRGERTLALPGDAAWFTPLGFVASRDGKSMASFYPPGLPLHLLLTGAVSPIAGVLLILFTFLIGARLHSEEAGLIAAVLMALCAVFVFESLQGMSDVLAAMWSAAAVFFVLRRWPVWGGFAFGMAVLVRPTSFLLLPALLIAIDGLKPVLRFVLGGLPCALFLAWYNHGAFGSILGTGYAAAGATREFALHYFPARAVHYAKWTAVQFSIVACVVALWGMRRRWVLIAWLAPFLVFYSFYFWYDEWWYTRFLLPAYPAIAVAAGIAFAELKWRRVSGALVILIAAWQLRQIARFGVLHTDEEQERAMAPVHWAAKHLPRNALVLSHEYSGALLYASTLKPVRFDRHPPLELGQYAVLMEHEIAPFLARYGSRARRLYTGDDGAVFVLK